MKQVVITVFPIVFLLGLGMFFKRKNILSNEQVEGLKFVSMNVFLPLVLFRSFLNNTYDLSTLSYLVVLFPLCLLMLEAGYLLKKRMKTDNCIPFMMTGFEVGMLGYALYGFLDGTGDLTPLALVDFGHSIFMFSTYFVLLNMSFGKGSVKDSILSTMRSPFFVAFISGLFCGVLGLGKLLQGSLLMGFIDALFEVFSKALSATILISLGYGIEIRKEVLKQSLILVVFRMILSFISAFIAIKAFDLLIGVDEKMLKALLVFFILPPTYTVAAYVKDARSMKLVSTMSSIYTILSVVSYLLIVLLFR